jgi:hypothetical protein
MESFRRNLSENALRPNWDLSEWILPKGLDQKIHFFTNGNLSEWNLLEWNLSKWNLSEYLFSIVYLPSKSIF